MTRRRNVPARASRPPRHHDHAPAPQCPDGWPDATTIREAVDLDPVVAAAADQATADNVYYLMQRIPSGFRQLMLREIGLQQASSVNRGMAGMVLARIRGDRSPADSQLLSMLTQPVLDLLDLPLGAAQWADLIGQDPHRAAGVLDAHPHLGAVLATVTDMAMPLRTAALASAIAHNAAASAVALTLLAVEDPTCARVHEQLTERFPQLPPIPAMDVTELLRAVQTSARRSDEPREKGATDDSDTFLNDFSQAALDDEPESPGDGARAGSVADRSTVTTIREELRALSIVLEPGHEADADEVVDAVDRVIDIWAEMIENAESVLDALRDGTLPDDAHLATAEFVPLVRLAARRCGQLLGQDIEPDRDDLATAVDDLREQALPTDELTHLMQLQAPPAVAAAAEAVRALARQALGQEVTGTEAGDEVDIEALQALHTLITGTRDRGRGYPVNDAVLVAADQMVRDRLPSAAPLLMHVLLGNVALPESAQSKTPLDWGKTDVAEASAAQDPPVGEPVAHNPASATVATEERPTLDDASQPAPAPAAARVPDVSLADARTGAARTDEAVPAEQPVPSQCIASPDRLPTTTSGGQSAASPVDTAPDAEAALAALLTSDRDSLSALVRRRSEESPTPSQNLGSGVPRQFDTGRAGPERTLNPATSNTVGTPISALELSAVERARRAQPALLTAGRFGLAADLLEAAGAAEASVAARRGVAYATALRYPTGELASAFSTVASILTRDGLADDRAGQLLAWAAAARLCLVSPSAGPASVLSGLAPVVSGSAALTEVGAALIEASRAGVVVLPETADAVGSMAAYEHQADAAAAQAADLLNSAASRPLKYVPANAVFQFWMSPTGPLGELLTLVATADTAHLGEVRDRIVELRGTADRRIDETRAVVRKRHHRETKIVAGARVNLTARYDEAIEVASRWAEAAERVEQATAEARSDAWQTPMLRKMRSRLTAVREQARTDLAAPYPGFEALDSEQDEVAAAHRVAQALLAETFAISDGQPAIGEEAPAVYVAHHELLATDLPLRPRSLLPDRGLGPDCLPALLRVAGEPATDPQTVYAHRAARGDHDLTAVLITGVRATDARTAATLDRQRTTGLGETAHAVTAEVAALIHDIDAQRMSGGLDDGPYSALSSRAEALQNLERTDFGRIRDEARAIGDDLSDQLRRKIDQTVTRITQRAAVDAAVAEIADNLTRFARQGQIASAEEYLEQRTLPQTPNRVDHLQQFFPAVPDLYAAAPELSQQLHDALAGMAPSSTVLRLAEYARADLATLSQERRTAGVRALSSLATLAPRQRQKQVEIRGALRHVLAEAGLEFSDATVVPEARGAAGRHWVTLTGVTGLGEALVPLLGSAMSPDGGTLQVLVVTSAPSPATVLEWTTSQPGDTTVLALWTGRPLTAAQRRDIADAARGRSHPPVLFLDAAALGYLACQSEPRRATFGAISLPMTAVSPFRDTPGGTAPEMFYGRGTEMKAVLDLTGPSVLYGGRQLGKSALLRAAAAEFEKMGEGRVAVLESIFTVGSEETHRDAGRLWEVLWPLLARRGIVPPSLSLGTGTGTAEAVYTHVLEWTRADPRHALLVLLDEADVFLDADAIGNRFTQVDWCRKIMIDSGRRVKFVFAGLHRTARFESLPNQPLSHLGRPLSIGPLRPQHAHDLLTEPLAAMGLRFADPTAGPARVLALANNMPALLQLFGRALMAHLTARPVDRDGPPSLITADDIDTVFADPDLRDAFRDKYQLTIRLDHRYMVIAYVLAEAAYDRGIDASLSLTELLDFCRQAWPAGFADMHNDVFRGLVTECVDLSVLAEDDDRYRIRTPTVLRLLGTEEHVLDVLYNRTSEMSVPSPTDASSYRSRLRNGTQRSPFTERQLGQLFAPDNRVLVITGSVALGVDKAVLALQEAAEKAQGRIDAVRRVPTLTADGIRRDLSLVAPGRRTLLVANALRMSAGALRELLDAAQAEMKAAALDRQVCLAVVAGPGNAAGWVTWPDRVELSRVDLPGLRLWTEEANLPFLDDQSLGELRDVTGGWPSVIGRVETLRSNDRAVETAHPLLDKVADYLTGNGAADLVHAAELHDGVLANVFTTVAGLTAREAEDLDSLTELLDIDDTLDREGVAAAGFTHPIDAVVALRALGCLTDDDRGGLRAEPVLAAAVNEFCRRQEAASARTRTEPRA
jgi:hypothetical protein